MSLEIDDVTWLNEFKERCTGSEISKEEKKRYWRYVGKIKRLNEPDIDDVKLLSEIRELMFKERFGEVKPTWILNSALSFVGIGIVIAIVLMKDYLWTGMIMTWVLFTILAITYLWSIDKLNNWKLAAIALSMTTGLTIILDLILYSVSIKWLYIFNQIGFIIVIPCLYLNGRIVGGWISGIKLDGVIRDIYYLVTMKINYESYLMAKPDKRQWIFFFGGIGTVVTSTIVSFVNLIYYDSYALFIFPILLLFGEILDYKAKAGKLSGGEFNHLRRERRIIQDWKNSL